MALRKIVQIDEDRCNGCGECVPNCAEGALRVIDGKAGLVKDIYCDGLGACLGTCPQDAIRIIEKDADEFDLAAATAFQAATKGAHGPAGSHHAAGGCPGAALLHSQADSADAPSNAGSAVPSQLRQWPVQLHLVPVDAPFLDGADLLLAADCAPFALADFHDRLLRGKRLLVGCPKLDERSHYAEKLTAMLKRNDVRSLTVAHMEVPCCGFVQLAREAVARSGKDIPIRDVTIGVRGEIKGDRPAPHAGAQVQSRR